MATITRATYGMITRPTRHRVAGCLDDDLVFLAQAATEPSSPERQSPRPVARATQFNRRGQTDARSAPDDNCLLLSSIPFSILRNHPTRFRDCPGAVALQFCRGLLPRNAANLHLGSFANTARACVFPPRAYFARGYFQKIWRGRVDARIGELGFVLRLIGKRGRDRFYRSSQRRGSPEDRCTDVGNRCLLSRWTNFSRALQPSLSDEPMDACN